MKINGIDGNPFRANSMSLQDGISEIDENQPKNRDFTDVVSDRTLFFSNLNLKHFFNSWFLWFSGNGMQLDGSSKNNCPQLFELTPQSALHIFNTENNSLRITASNAINVANMDDFGEEFWMLLNINQLSQKLSQIYHFFGKFTVI